MLSERSKTWRTPSVCLHPDEMSKRAKPQEKDYGRPGSGVGNSINSEGTQETFTRDFIGMMMKIF